MFSVLTTKFTDRSTLLSLIENKEDKAYYKNNMIAYLQGKVILKQKDFIILEVNGVGYEIFLSKAALNKISQSEEELKIFCYLDVGERSLKLYGFLSFEELGLFRILRNISGIGPRASLDICAVGSPKKVKEEIEKGNEKIFEGIPGIGRKKAKKIILELSGKLKISEPSPQKQDIPEDEALLALIKLGFQKKEAQRVLSQIPKEIKDSQERVKQALKILGK